MTEVRDVKPAWASSALWLFGSSLLRNLGFAAVLFILAWLSTPEIVGEYALALAITSPLFIVSQLGLRYLYLTADRPLPFRAFISVQWLTLLGAFCVTTVIGLLWAKSSLMLLLLVGLTKAGDSIIELLSGPLQKTGKSSAIFLASLASTSLGILGVYVGLALQANVNLALGLLALSTLIIGPMVQVAALLRDQGFRVTGQSERQSPATQQRYLWKHGIPLGLSIASIALVASIPQLVLKESWGPAALAVFATYSYLIMGGDLLSGAIANAWIQRGSWHRDQAQASDSLEPSFLRVTIKTASKWVPLFLLGGAVISMSGYWLMPLILGAQYVISFAAVIVIMFSISVLPFVSFGLVALSIENRYRQNMYLSGIAVGVSILASFVFIPLWGVMGAFLAGFLALAARAAVPLALLRADA